MHGKFKGQAYNLIFIFSEYQSEVVCKVITETMGKIMQKTTTPIFSLIFIISLDAFIVCKHAIYGLLKDLVKLCVYCSFLIVDVC